MTHRFYILTILLATLAIAIYAIACDDDTPPQTENPWTFTTTSVASGTTSTYENCLFFDQQTLTVLDYQIYPDGNPHNMALEVGGVSSQFKFVLTLEEANEDIEDSPADYNYALTGLQPGFTKWTFEAQRDECTPKIVEGDFTLPGLYYPMKTEIIPPEDGEGEPTIKISTDSIRTFGAGASDTIYSMVSDGTNIYLVGSFESTVNMANDFDADDYKTSLGESDGFIVSISADFLTYNWSRIIGGSGDDRIYDIAMDGSNLYVAGHFTGTVDFQEDFGGDDELTATGGLQDAFIMKLDTSGGYGWTTAINILDEDSATTIVVDSQHDAYAGGMSNATDDTNTDLFLAKVAADGTPGWVNSLASTEVEQLNELALDGSDGIYLSGVYQGDTGSLDFAPFFQGSPPAINATRSGGGDGFIIKTNTDGTYANYNYTLSHSGSDSLYAMTFDASDNLYFGGCSSENGGSGDAFFGYMPAGSTTPDWVQFIGALGEGSGMDLIRKIVLDSEGNYFLLGVFSVAGDGLDFMANFTNYTATYSLGGTAQTATFQDIRTSESNWTDAFIMHILNDRTYDYTYQIKGVGIEGGVVDTLAFHVSSATDPQIIAAGTFTDKVNFSYDFPYLDQPDKITARGLDGFIFRWDTVEPTP